MDGEPYQYQPQPENEMSFLDEMQNNISEIEEDEINTLLDWCYAADHEGSHYHGMTYEQGIRDAFEFIAGEIDGNEIIGDKK